MKKMLLTMVFLGGVLIAAPNQNMQGFSNLDMNHDGKITQSEFEQMQQKRMTERAEAGYPMKNAGNAPSFAAMDKNKDGVVDAMEFRNFQQTRRQDRMQNQMNNGMGQGMMGGKGGGKGR